MEQEIFFHVGLGKTASTYLQNRFFPKLKKIKYISTHKFYRYSEIIARSNAPKLLFSREMDRQFMTEVSKIGNLYPKARIIIVLRQNDQWIASQYRRHLKNGGVHSFEEFLDLNQDQGLWKQQDVRFKPMLELVDRLFVHPPLVLLYEEMSKDLSRSQNITTFLDKILKYTGAEVDMAKVNLSPKHTSYSKKQLYTMHRVSQLLFKKNSQLPRNKVLHYVVFRSKWLFCHIVLYVAALLPDRWFKSKKLISAQSLEKVRAFYASDWSYCIDFAREKSAIPYSL